MQFSPPYAENIDEDNEFARDRQNTNIDQNLNNMRTGTLWFNPPNNEGMNASNNELGATNVNVGVEAQHQRKSSVNVDPESKHHSRKRKKKSIAQK